MALEQSFGNADVQTLTYLAAAGRKLMRLDIYNQPNPSFTGESDLMTNGADSSYNALQAQYRRRFTHSLRALAPYTWAHSIDGASSDVYFLHVPPNNAAASQERGPVKTLVTSYLLLSCASKKFCNVVGSSGLKARDYVLLQSASSALFGGRG